MQQNYTTFIDRSAKIAAINEELLKLERKLATPERTVQDIVRHIELLKELQETE
ncbi:MAG: hypothetical protein HFK06_03860 [Clostridia bacterium]|jgi:hypothetical protein|nr:hypothetical protein [Clostridia bacterium]